MSLHLATPTSSAAFSATTNRLTAATYDNAGNMTAHPFITPSGSIGYNANNLATQFTATGSTASYGYDAQGRRVRVTHNGVTTLQVYDAMGRLAVEYSTQAPAQTNGVYYQTTDNLGSTRIVTDSAGQVKLRRDFFPFGEEIPASASYGNRHQVLDNGVATYNAWSGIPQQFTGQQRDSTGLDYFWARNFSGPSGRFLSVDPGNAGARSETPQGWNSFAYVLNNPLRLVDPDGLDPCPSNPNPDEPHCVEVVAPYPAEVPPSQPGQPSSNRGGYEEYYGGQQPDYTPPKSDVEINEDARLILEGIWKKTWPIAEPFCEGSGQFFLAGSSNQVGAVPAIGGAFIWNLDGEFLGVGGGFGYTRSGRGRAGEVGSITVVGGLDTVGGEPFSLSVVPAIPVGPVMLGPVIGIGTSASKLGIGATFGLFQVGVSGQLSFLGGCSAQR